MVGKHGSKILVFAGLAVLLGASVYTTLRWHSYFVTPQSHGRESGWFADAVEKRPESRGPSHDRWNELDVNEGKAQGPLRCHLVPWPKAPNETNPPDLRFELINPSAEAVSLWYATFPHFHVTFLVRDENGKVMKGFPLIVLSSAVYGCDSQTGRARDPLPPVRTLEPGETYTWGCYLSIFEEYMIIEKPGRYRLEAVFAYTDLGGFPEPDQRILARSEPVLIEVQEGANKAERGSWKLVANQ